MATEDANPKVGPVWIRELTLRGLLSFGPDTPPLEMRPLNVLVGPNGSGKSNLIEAIDLLRSTASKFSATIRAGGNPSEWIWKTTKEGSFHDHAHIEALVAAWPVIRHQIEFANTFGYFQVSMECIEEIEGDVARIVYKNQNHKAVLVRHDGTRHALAINEHSPTGLSIDGISSQDSILSQRKDPSQYSHFYLLSKIYSDARIYREWSFGRSSIFRTPQPADMPRDYLAEDFSNLGLFLNRLGETPKAKSAFISNLRDLYSGLDDYHVNIKGGTVEVFLTEDGHNIPASRLSDGTLRYLCLLAILCDPTPPGLICIEEPELGLHPDLLPKIADLLIEASARTQLIVTTHSDILIDALSEQPESVVVFEKHDGKTQMHRLEATAELQEWLKKYRLGQLWTRGEIGGTRW